MGAIVGRGVALVLVLAACGAGPREPVAHERPQRVQVQTLASSPERLTREELLRRLQARLSRPAGGLRVQTGVDGTRRIALDGHLQHATIAVVGADGRVRTSCVDSPAAAAHALGVEPAVSAP